MKFFASVTINRCHIQRFCRIARETCGIEFPFDNVIVSPLVVRNGVLPIVKEHKRHCKVMFDSGGFHIQQGQFELRDIVRRIAIVYESQDWADRYVVPDVPITSRDSNTVAKQKLRSTIGQYKAFCQRVSIDRLRLVNPYNRKIVQKSILNPVDANYVDPDGKKLLQRQLHGYSISSKRYALYEKIGKTDVKILDPKAHGIGFLYPPKDSPKKWKEDVAQWVYEMWDYIVRGVLKLKRKTPSWLDIPQMMRLTITTHNVLEMLGDWEVARPYNFLLMPMVDPDLGCAFDKRKDQKVMLVTAFSSKQKRWFDLECINIYGGKKYRMVNANKEKNPPDNVVLPWQFSHRLVEYQEHPEAKSLAPDGTPCKSDTKGLLKRAHIVAGELRYIGKETDRKWEEGDDASVLEFKATEYGRSKMVIASEEVKKDIEDIGINKCARESKFDRKNIIRKLVRGLPVKRNSYTEFERWLKSYKSQIGVKS